MNMTTIADRPRHRSMQRAKGLLACAVIATLAMTPVASGVVVLCDPIMSDRLDWTWVTDLKAIPSDGSPQLVSVFLDSRWGWENQTIGSVYLTRYPKSEEVVALSPISPHLGAMIAYDRNRDVLWDICLQPEFGTFDGHGKRVGGNVSLRDMDSLNVDVRGEDVFIQFQLFQIRTPDKIPRR